MWTGVEESGDLLVRGDMDRMQLTGSLQWFSCHSALLEASLGYGSREISPCCLHSKAVCCGNQLVILPSALMKPSKHRDRGISCRGKNCSKRSA